MKDKIKEFVGSGIGRAYLLTTSMSVAAISLGTGDLGAGIAIGGWIGAISTIAVNEVTDGYLMDDSWIAPRKDDEPC